MLARARTSPVVGRKNSLVFSELRTALSEHVKEQRQGSCHCEHSGNQWQGRSIRNGGYQERADDCTYAPGREHRRAGAAHNTFIGIEHLTDEVRAPLQRGRGRSRQRKARRAVHGPAKRTQVKSN